jgi:lipid II:glycine glycyltransferase (peptidoglycan interpeptide bridge formation enzyme)
MKVTAERDGFSVRPLSYFKRLLDFMGKNARLYLAFYNGAAIAGAIAVNYAKKTSYVYGASDNAFRNVMPNYLVQWEMIRWAVQTGSSIYDLQGISGNLEEENNHLYGLYRFKRGFNGQIDELAGEFDRIYLPV